MALPAARRLAVLALVAAAVATLAADGAPARAAVVRPAGLSPCDRTAPATLRAAVEIFLRSAVARTDLGSSYAAVTAAIRQSQSCEEWRSGTIAVVPYAGLDWGRSGIARAWCTDGGTMFAVRAVAADGVLPDTLFLLGVRSLADGTWAVDYWLPALARALPARPLVALDDFVGGAGAGACGGAPGRVAHHRRRASWRGAVRS